MNAFPSRSLTPHNPRTPRIKPKKVQQASTHPVYSAGSISSSGRTLSVHKFMKCELNAHISTTPPSLACTKFKAVCFLPPHHTTSSRRGAKSQGVESAPAVFSRSSNGGGRLNNRQRKLNTQNTCHVHTHRAKTPPD